MANTNDLRNVIEPALLKRFWKAVGAEPIVPSVDLKRELSPMKFDGIGIHRSERSLLFCEATASGFLGNRGRDFHVGAMRKFADSFARFSIITHTSVRDALLQAVKRDYRTEFVQISCHLVVPKGSRFIRALGYRTKLLELGVMKLVEIELPEEERTLLEQVLKAASAEMS